MGLPEKFSVANEFPQISYEQWRASAESGLDGAPFEKKLVTHTYEGFDIQPIYTRQTSSNRSERIGFPGFPPFIRGSRVLGCSRYGWDLRVEYSHPDPALTNRSILDDLENGSTSIALRFCEFARSGLDADFKEASAQAGHGGIMVYSVDDLANVLKNVHLEMIAVALEPGAAFMPAAVLLATLWKRSGSGLKEARGAFNADPIAVLARDGHLPLPTTACFRQMSDLAVWTASECPNVTSIGVDTTLYSDAGATATEALGIAMATAVEYLRALDMEVAQAAPQFLFKFGLGTDHFMGIAKLRAARRLWCRVVEACGGSPSSAAMKIHARTSDCVLTRRDPHVNILRNCVAAFAAGIGGADAITTLPFDVVAGNPDEHSQRVARNTILVLQEETHLHQVLDPAGGSWFLDELTDQLAQRAWQFFQEIELHGGMLEALQCGWISERVCASHLARAKDIARRKLGITGVSEFPDINEQAKMTQPLDLTLLRKNAIERVKSSRERNRTVDTSSIGAAIESAEAGATIGQLAESYGFQRLSPITVDPLVPHRYAESFERLRDMSDAWQAVHGHRPQVFLANMGPPAHFNARATYAKNFFEAGGFAVLSNNGFHSASEAAEAFRESQTHIAVICSSDKLYPEVVPAVAHGLKLAGASTVILAGNPGDKSEAWRTCGVDEFIYIKCDVLETLGKLLRREGVVETEEPVQ